MLLLKIKVFAKLIVRAHFHHAYKMDVLLMLKSTLLSFIVSS